ncbi:hypothetical protein FHW79_000017 [Azospirillum sp. OGB3]|uniref:hypothetical protein n=1 Tax=Azospirillum sp. OGB3 TaxID=2587012 RepID=UPI00160619E0|nr:hypothetical protein [Azospirillum sp. OGB3]MBB3262430.1 hypothetical protein [Azospirillum sp. OGB3]
MSFVSVSGSTLTLTLSNATLTAGDSINFRCIDPNGSDDASGIIQSAPGGLDALGFDAVLTVGAARPVPALQSPRRRHLHHHRRRLEPASPSLDRPETSPPGSAERQVRTASGKRRVGGHAVVG